LLGHDSEARDFSKEQYPPDPKHLLEPCLFLLSSVEIITNITEAILAILPGGSCPGTLPLPHARAELWTLTLKTIWNYLWAANCKARAETNGISTLQGSFMRQFVPGKPYINGSQMEEILSSKGHVVICEFLVAKTKGRGTIGI
jgi:hypothetical protein